MGKKFTRYVGGTGSKLGLECHCDWVQDIAKNQSTVTLTVYLSHKQFKTEKDFNGYVMIGSRKKSFVMKAFEDKGTSDEWRKDELVSFTHIIKHDRDGNKTISVSGRLAMDGGIYGGVSIGGIGFNESIALTRILPSSRIAAVKASMDGQDDTTYTVEENDSPSLNVGDFYIGEKCKVTWQPKSDSLKYKITFVMNDYTYETDYISPNCHDTDYTFENYTIGTKKKDADPDLISQMPNATSGLMSATLQAYDGDKKTGSEYTVYFTVKIPETSEYKPTLNNSVQAEATEKYKVAVEGEAVPYVWFAIPGYSKVHIQAEAVAKHGAKIVAYKITGGYNTTKQCAVLDYTGDIINHKGVIPFTVTAIDSRGMESDPCSANVVFTDYQPPQINTVLVTRGSVKGANTLTIASSWDRQEMIAIEGTDRNASTVAIQYRTVNGGEWISLSTEAQEAVTASNDGRLTTTQTYYSKNTFVFAHNTSYELRFTVTDNFGKKAVQTVFIPTDIVLVDFNDTGNGIAIGKMSEKAGLEVAFDAEFTGETTFKDEATFEDKATFAAIDILVNGNTISLKDYIKGVMDNTY